MDGGKSSRRLNLLLAILFIIALLLIVNIATMAFLPQHKDTQYAMPGRDGKDGKDAQVDYPLINGLIQQQVQDAVNALPRPRDGKDGINGIDGLPGAKGEKGDKGDPAVICRQIEVRQNPSTGAAEFRYVGDDIWQPAPQDGVIQNQCEPQDGPPGGAI